MSQRAVKRAVVVLALAGALALGATACQPANQYTADSTAYCLQGQMASGKYVYDGAVAMNTYPGTNTWIPFGQKFRIDSGPLTGKVVTVEDRYGYGTQFDIWIPSCNGAYQYGRHSIQITDLGR